MVECHNENYTYIPDGCLYPVVGFVASPLSGKSPHTVFFQITCSTEGDDYPVEWCMNFGDGSSDSGYFNNGSANVSHTYLSKDGVKTTVYKPTVTVKTQCGSVKTHASGDRVAIYVYDVTFETGPIVSSGTTVGETFGFSQSSVLKMVLAFGAGVLIFYALRGR